MIGHLGIAYNTALQTITPGIGKMNFEIASLMIQDENFIGALALIAFFAGQIPGFIRLLRDTQDGHYMVDMTKKRS